MDRLPKLCFGQSIFFFNLELKERKTMLKRILQKCLDEQPLLDDELKYLLSARDEQEVSEIYRTARELRYRYFGPKVYLYGFVYFSTYCHNECAFCYYRASNQKPPRYRKALEEIVKTAVELKESGVHLIDLTMGEDRYFSPDRLSWLVKAVKQATGLPVMISPGVIDESAIRQLAEAGADWYALYQETHNRQLFARLRLAQSYELRMAAKKQAAKAGMLLEEGLLTGVGDEIADTVHSLRVMQELKAAQVRSMTFVPQSGTPLEAIGQPGYERELRNIAVMRLLFPEALIPASLDVDGLNGLESRLKAGANVVTSIIPPQKGLAGVAQAEYDIDEGYRTVTGIQSALKRCGVQAASAEEYRQRLVLLKKRFGG
ncbi:MAG: methylornithine synthase PylB [bacterium]